MDITENNPSSASSSHVRVDPNQLSPIHMRPVFAYGSINRKVHAVVALNSATYFFYLSISAPSTASKLTMMLDDAHAAVLNMNPSGVGFRGINVRWAEVAPSHATMDSSTTIIVPAFHASRQAVASALKTSFHTANPAVSYPRSLPSSASSQLPSAPSVAPLPLGGGYPTQQYSELVSTTYNC